MNTVTPSAARSDHGQGRYADLDRNDGVARERPGSSPRHSRTSAAEGNGLVQGHRRTEIATDGRTLGVSTAATRSRSVAR